MHVAQLELLEDIQVEVSEVMDRVEPGRLIRGAEAWVLRHEHLIALREQLHERPHARRAVGPVQVKELRPFAAALERDARAAHAEILLLERHQSTLISAPRTPPLHLSKSPFMSGGRPWGPSGVGSSEKA